ncbi:hypothetical protein BH23ACT5_BH23ACT5_18560 [soil metagenome]
MDACGPRLEIYGSGGWGFESLRACYRNPCVCAVSLCGGWPRGAALGAILHLRRLSLRGYGLVAAMCVFA